MKRKILFAVMACLFLLACNSKDEPISKNELRRIHGNGVNSMYAELQEAEDL